MRKKIAIFVTKLSGGGAEKVAANLSIYLSKQHDVFIILFSNKRIDYNYKGNLICINSKPSNNIIGKLIRLIYRIYKVKVIKKKYKINTTISFMEGPNIINILSKANDKVILSVHTTISKRQHDIYYRIYGKLIKLLYNKAYSIVTVSNEIKEDLINNFKIKKEKIKTIYNSVNILSVNKLSKEKIESNYKSIFNDFTIINMGRLAYPKGQWHLIRAMKKINEIRPDINLVILGEGELEKYLKRLTKQLSLENTIHFLGYRKNPYKYISNSNIFVMSSLFEGFCISLIEAMACKMPVISSDCKSGIKEILAPKLKFDKRINNIKFAKYGILVPACDGNFYSANEQLTKEESTLVNSIIQLSYNEKTMKKYSDISYKRAKDFNNDQIMHQWIKII